MKYSTAELKKKALFLLQLKSLGDMRYTTFCIRLMLITDKSRHFIEKQIVKLAKG